MTLSRLSKAFWQKTNPSSKAIKPKTIVLLGTNTAAKSANTRIRIKKKKLVSALSPETKEGPISEIKAARHVAVMAAPNKTSFPEAKTQSTIHKIRKSSRKRKSKNFRLEMVAAKVA